MSEELDNPGTFEGRTLLLKTRVSRAGISDAQEVMDLITRCAGKMQAEGIDQWDGVYPSLAIVEADAEAGSLFVVRMGGKCIASISIDEVQPEPFTGLPWSDVDGRPLFIHRLAVDPEWEGMRIGRQLMDEAERFAKEAGFTSIRLDTYGGNLRAMNLYLKRGYKPVGQVVYPRREMVFECLEWVVGRE